MILITKNYQSSSVLKKALFLIVGLFMISFISGSYTFNLHGNNISSSSNTLNLNNANEEEIENEGKIQFPSTPQESAAYLIGNWSFDNDYANSISGAPPVTPFGGAYINATGGINGKGFFYVNGSYSYGEIAAWPSYNGPNITIEFWMRSVSDYFGAQNIIYKGDGNGHVSYELYRQPWDVSNNGELVMAAQDNTGIFYETNGTSNITHNEWHFITMCIEQYEISYYVDGNLKQNELVGGSGITVNLSSILYLGGQDSGSSEVHLDELKIYSGILSASDIWDHYTMFQPIAHLTSNATAEMPQGTQVTFITSNSYGGTGYYIIHLELWSGYIITFYHFNNFTETYSDVGTYRVVLTIIDTITNKSSTDFVEFNIIEDPKYGDDQYEDNDIWTNPSLINLNSSVPEYILDLFMKDDDFFMISVPAGFGVEMTLDGLTGFSFIFVDLNPNTGEQIRNITGTYQYSNGDNTRLTFIGSTEPQNYLVGILKGNNTDEFNYSLDLLLVVYSSQDQTTDSTDSSTTDSNSSTSNNTNSTTNGDGSSENPFGAIDGYSATNLTIFTTVAIFFLVVITKKQHLYSL